MSPSPDAARPHSANAPPAVLAETRDDCAVLTLANPPVNGLGLEMREALLEALERAQADPDVRAIVLRGAGRMFCGGADIRQFGTPKASQAPLLRDVNRAIEASAKPVVAAIHGHALGAGLELALSCHWRIAEPTSGLGLPEVRLGFVPGGGGTQRLPRLVGVVRALEMIDSGAPVPAASALAAGLLDRIPEGDVVDAAVALAHEGLAVTLATRVTSRRTAARAGEDDSVAIEAARRRVDADDPNRKARLECIRCIEAATRLGIEAGLDLERAAFTTLVASEESVRARQAFFAARSRPGEGDDR